MIIHQGKNRHTRLKICIKTATLLVIAWILLSLKDIYSQKGGGQWLLTASAAGLALLTIASFSGLGGIISHITNSNLASKEERVPAFLRWAVHFLLGSVTFAFISFISISFGVQLYKGISTLALISGVYWTTRTARLFKLPAQPLNFPIVAFLALATLKLTRALTPDLHPDALWYHLTGPLSWIKNGGFFLPLNAIQLMQASYWESLYLAPLTFIGSSTTEELVIVQVFCQVIVWASALATSIVAAQLLNKLLPSKLDLSWMFLVTLAVFATTELSLSLPTPKNDWGVAGWFILGLYYLISSCHRIGAFVLALALGAKFSYLIIGLAFLFLIFSLISSKRQRLEFIAIFGIGIAPVLTRNIILTGNPLFPVLDTALEVIRGYPILPLTWSEALREYSQINLLPSFSHLQRIFLSAFPLNQLLTLLIFLPSAKDMWRSFWGLRIYIFISLSLIFFIFTTGDKAELRLIGAIPVLISGLSIYGLYHARNIWGIRLIPAKYLPILASLYIILAGETNWGFIKSASIILRPIDVVRADPINRAIYNLQNKPCADDGVLLAYDTRLFYQYNCGVIRVWDSLEISNIFEKDDAAVVLKELPAKFRYLVISRTVIDNFQKLTPVRSIESLTLKRPEAIVAKFDGGILLDIHKLRNLIEDSK